MHSSDTPLMKQYNSIKVKYPEYILFFRLGDFYEMFYNDAIIASKILNITLTTRDKKKEDSVPLCGIPYHSAQTYIKRLLNNGLKVAICEQLEDPKYAKKIVKRDVIRLITPGTILETELLDEKEANFLASFFINEKDEAFGVAFLDLSTGEFLATEYSGKDYFSILKEEFMNYEPKEIIVPRQYLEDTALKGLFANLPFHVSPIDTKLLTFNNAKEKAISTILKISDNKFEKRPNACIAAEFLIEYLHETQKKTLAHIKPLNFYLPSDFMVLDHSTIVNLELVRSIDSGQREGTLLSILDHTSTPMGARRLKDWILHPLQKINRIRDRLDCVEELVKKPNTCVKIRELLKKIYDLERICGRISSRIATPQNILTLKNCIPFIQKIKNEGKFFDTQQLKEYMNRCNALQEVYSLIDYTLVDDLILCSQKTGFIKPNVDKTLQHLYDVSRGGKTFIKDLEKSEREKTGISSLKVGYNKIFGFFIEVTKANFANVPNNYIRKQTLVNSERYITEELKRFEYEILGAEEKIQKIEKQLFDELINSLISYIPLIQETALVLSYIDCLISFAELAATENYVKPALNSSYQLEILQGRHPVLDIIQKEKPFVPNDTFMDSEENQLVFLTGPNMAGKSTYMRQVALIVLMAQIGSFVPAQKATIGIVDRIFTRIGASDKLYKGQSTFMVEMTETASILNQATKRSLIVLDEIGRGTSTYDGISIAWAVAEYLHDCHEIGARTLFATHYYELTELTNFLNRARNYTMAIYEDRGKVEFLYNVKEGVCDKSYGVHVAELAGLPSEVIKRAYQILEELEKKKNIDIKKLNPQNQLKEFSTPTQLPLFFDSNALVIEEIKGLDPTRLSPLNALQKINEWKKALL